MPEPELLVTTVHRADCRFGPGFFRLSLKDGGVRHCMAQEEVELVHALLGPDQVIRVERDGHCLDGDRLGDARTPDVVDAELWLAMDKRDGMRALGLTREADYRRAYNDVEAAVSRRNNREAQTGVHASIIIKRKGVRVSG